MKRIVFAKNYENNKRIMAKRGNFTYQDNGHNSVNSGSIKQHYRKQGWMK